MSGETEREVSGWTVDTLHSHLLRMVLDTRKAFNERMSDMQRMLDERHASQNKAVDAALVAQQTAMRTAMDAAGKAVDKAELAAEKRFESVNEFRAQLTDQAATFPTRNEVDVRLSALSEKLDTDTKRNAATLAELELRLTSRLDLNQGQQAGSSDYRSEHRLDVNTLLQFAGFVIVAIGLVFALLH